MKKNAKVALCFIMHKWINSKTKNNKITVPRIKYQNIKIILKHSKSKFTYFKKNRKII